MSKRGRPVRKAIVAAPRATLVAPRVVVRAGASTALVTSYLARYTSSGSRRALGESLTRAARLLNAPDAVDVDWLALEAEDIARIRLGLAKLYKPSTAQLTCSAVAGVLRQAWRRGEVDRDRVERLLDQPPIKGTRLPAGRALAPDELAALIRVAATAGPAAARAGAILALGFSCGLRRAEIAALKTSNIERGHDGRMALRVVGKGDRERRIPVAAGTVYLLDRWMERRGPADGWIVCALDGKGGEPVPGVGVKPNTIWRILGQFRTAAGIAKIAPHDLRRTFATALFDADEKLSVVQGLMGHSDPRTTQLYDMRPERGREAAVDKLPFLGTPET